MRPLEIAGSSPAAGSMLPNRLKSPFTLPHLSSMSNFGPLSAKQSIQHSQMSNLFTFGPSLILTAVLINIAVGAKCQRPTRRLSSFFLLQLNPDKFTERTWLALAPFQINIRFNCFKNYIFEKVSRNK
jgi:hypothetical protein